ncbi:PTS system, trehalose-specific IIC component [Granulicatella balaenopterae]|uniref:PTS system, trehalose-specific IIC component n=1 Tax=Granulicatella balaenopterae TaxID=137733 RepID=A0A1H9LM42_9LACT|nr:PTS system trehalose-specific EIIBC component [Granulicatella balaenopterae]SER12551.1 PTS system, trehalose-specific IIC component [Granulicatella balaenopterae]
MTDFKQQAQELLHLLGGPDNIAAVTHCATRMRFVLNNPSIADVKQIEKLKAVKGTFTQAGQFQVIIGNDVSVFYNDFIAISGKQGVSKDEVKKAAKQNQNWLQRAMAVLAEIFTPIIPAIIVGGLILGFRNILEGVPMEILGQKMTEGQPVFDALGNPVFNKIVDVSPFWNGVNAFLWLPGEAIFHFLPVGITWSVTKKMGTTQILGIVLGICLVSPQLLNAYGYAGALADGTIPFWDFGYFTIDKIGYQAQVLPAIFAGFTLSYLEIWLRKWIPNAVSMIFVPFFALIPTIILAHTVLGPVGWQMGQWISFVVLAGLTGPLNWLFGALFGAFYSPLVITGLHHMTNAIDMQLISDFGGTQLWPMIALSNIAQGSAVMAIWWLHRGDKEEEQVSIPAAISCYLGVTEPAMFGINLKYVFPFVAAMIGSGIAGFISTITKVTANSIGVGGLPGFLVIRPGSMVMFLICMVIVLVVPFVLTIIFDKKKLFQSKK